MSPLRRNPWTGRTVLFAILGCFAVVLAANAAMAIFALSSHPGLVTQNAYLEGLRFNQTLERDRMQAGLGWRYDVAYEPERRRLVFRVEGSGGRPIDGLAGSLRLRRPGAGEQTIALSQTVAGAYSADADLALPGRWLVRIDAVDPQGRRIRVERELWRD